MTTALTTSHASKNIGKLKENSHSHSYSSNYSKNSKKKNSLKRNHKKNQFYTLDKEGTNIVSVKMPKKRINTLTNEIFESSLQAKGNIVAITKTNGERYSGVFFNLKQKDEGNFVIELKLAQKLDSLDQPPNQRTNHPCLAHLEITTDELSHLEV